jgi:hypothetical protein
MADQSNNPVGCLGRVLTFIGSFWLVIVVLAGMGVLSEFGLGGEIFAWVGGTIIPALLLLAAGRALRRRARAMEQETTVIVAPTPPGVPGRRVPTTRTETPQPAVTPPVLPGRAPPTSRPVPRQLEPLPPPAPTPAPAPARGLEEVIPPPTGEGPEEKPTAGPAPVIEPRATRPKSSRELVEEARQKWGGRRRS